MFRAIGIGRNMPARASLIGTRGGPPTVRRKHARRLSAGQLCEVKVTGNYLVRCEARRQSVCAGAGAAMGHAEQVGARRDRALEAEVVPVAAVVVGRDRRALGRLEPTGDIGRPGRRDAERARLPDDVRVEVPGASHRILDGATRLADTLAC